MKDLAQLVRDNWPIFVIGSLVCGLLVFVLITP